MVHSARTIQEWCTWRAAWEVLVVVAGGILLASRLSYGTLPCTSLLSAPVFSALSTHGATMSLLTAGTATTWQYSVLIIVISNKEACNLVSIFSNIQIACKSALLAAIQHHDQLIP
eukprot:363096-Chlamydomonas_euryale.AAC.9